MQNHLQFGFEANNFAFGDVVGSGSFGDKFNKNPKSQYAIKSIMVRPNDQKTENGLIKSELLILEKIEKITTTPRPRTIPLYYTTPRPQAIPFSYGYFIETTRLR